MRPAGFPLGTTSFSGASKISPLRRHPPKCVASAPAAARCSTRTAPAGPALSPSHLNSPDAALHITFDAAPEFYSGSSRQRGSSESRGKLVLANQESRAGPRNRPGRVEPFAPFRDRRSLLAPPGFSELFAQRQRDPDQCF